MKKLITLLAFLTACSLNIQAQELSEKEYREQYRRTLDSIRVLTNEADSICGAIRSAWSEGIHDNTYKGEKVKDFSEAVYLAQLALWAQRTSIGLQNTTNKIYIKKLNRYPSSMKQAFDEILELGIKADELCRMADSPEGSYNSYSNGSRDLYNEIRKKLYELEMRYTD